MNPQHERIALMCAQLKLERISADWPHLAQRFAEEQASSWICANGAPSRIASLVVAHTGKGDRAWISLR